MLKCNVKFLQSGDECANDVTHYLYEEVPELKDLDNNKYNLAEVQDHINCPSKALHVYVSSSLLFE